jgi:hypothetical protein
VLAANPTPRRRIARPATVESAESEIRLSKPCTPPAGKSS